MSTKAIENSGQSSDGLKNEQLQQRIRVFHDQCRNHPTLSKNEWEKTSHPIHHSLSLSAHPPSFAFSKPTEHKKVNSSQPLTELKIAQKEHELKKGVQNDQIL
jgi:hypothetical protein